MKHKIFTVHDRKTGAFLRPFFMPTRPSAERAFMDFVNDEGHEFGKHPEDYTLFYVGEFEDSTAVITKVAPESVGNGITYLVIERDGSFLLEGEQVSNG